VVPIKAVSSAPRGPNGSDASWHSCHGLGAFQPAETAL